MSLTDDKSPQKYLHEKVAPNIVAKNQNDLLCDLGSLKP